MLGHVAIDGTKLEANASKHKSMSHGKLTEQEQYWRQQIDEMLQGASEVDEEEGRGGQHRTNALPAELAGARGRLKRLEQAKRELEQEAQQQLEEAKRAWSWEARAAPQRRRAAAPHKKVSQGEEAILIERCATWRALRGHRISPTRIHARCTVTRDSWRAWRA
jgi:hypothetical protein